jgi:hypothetical protein
MMLKYAYPILKKLKQMRVSKMMKKKIIWTKKLSMEDFKFLKIKTKINYNSNLLIKNNFFLKNRIKIFIYLKILKLSIKD